MPTDELVLHEVVARALQRLERRPAHAVLIVGPPGSGKAVLARTLAARLLQIPTQQLETYPYLTVVAPIDGKAIPIESIRDLQHFLSLKIPGGKAIARIVVIEDAHLLTTEAQNALLKTLEEPPADTVIILTATGVEALLPTIRSRVRTLQALPPSPELLKEYFKTRGFAAAQVDKALMLGGGLPGLAHALLTDQTGHPLYEATLQARTLLQASAYERLALVDGLSKQKQQSQYMVFILGEMARMALLRSTDATSKAALRWQKILKAAYEAQRQLRTNAQPKLILINLMLEL